jgi:hypothetical protein
MKMQIHAVVNPDGRVCIAVPTEQSTFPIRGDLDTMHPSERRRMHLLRRYPTFREVESELYPTVKHWQRWFQEVPFEDWNIRAFRAAKHATRNTPWESFELALAYISK